MKAKSLVINPLKNEVYFEDKEIVDSDSSEQIVRWDVSCVCASERRRFNKQKSHSDLTPFVAGHESVGLIEGHRNLHVLLPHSNCLTQG